MQTTEQNDITKSHKTKKVWQKPDFQILDYGSNINAKTHFATREASIHKSFGIYVKNGYKVSTHLKFGTKSSFHS